MQQTLIPNALHRPAETTELSRGSQFVSLRCWCICIQINDRQERREANSQFAAAKPVWPEV